MIVALQRHNEQLFS